MRHPDKASLRPTTSFMVGYEIIIVFALVVFLLLALYREWFRTAVSFFVVIVVLAVFGILTPKDVLLGFANEQLAVIVLLLTLSEVIRSPPLSMCCLIGCFGRLNPFPGLLGA